MFNNFSICGSSLFNLDGKLHNPFYRMMPDWMRLHTIMFVCSFHFRLNLYGNQCWYISTRVSCVSIQIWGGHSCSTSATAIATQDMKKKKKQTCEGGELFAYENDDDFFGEETIRKVFEATKRTHISTKSTLRASHHNARHNFGISFENFVLRFATHKVSNAPIHLHIFILPKQNGSHQ